jgi:hypothetical protein
MKSFASGLRKRFKQVCEFRSEALADEDRMDLKIKSKYKKRFTR